MEHALLQLSSVAGFERMRAPVRRE